MELLVVLQNLRKLTVDRQLVLTATSNPDRTMTHFCVSSSSCRRVAGVYGGAHRCLHHSRVRLLDSLLSPLSRRLSAQHIRRAIVPHSSHRLLDRVGVDHRTGTLTTAFLERSLSVRTQRTYPPPGPHLQACRCLLWRCRSRTANPTIRWCKMFLQTTGRASQARGRALVGRPAVRTVSAVRQYSSHSKFSSNSSIVHRGRRAWLVLVLMVVAPVLSRSGRRREPRVPCSRFRPLKSKHPRHSRGHRVSLRHPHISLPQLAHHSRSAIACAYPHPVQWPPRWFKL